MPSITNFFKSFFSVIETADAVADVSHLVGHLKGPGDDDKGEEMRLQKNRRIGAAIVQIAGPFFALEKEIDRKAFIADDDALKRVTVDYYGRLGDDAARDKFERLMGDIWSSILEGLGMRHQQQSQPPKNQPGQKPRQNQSQVQSPIGNIPPMDILLAVQVSLGKSARMVDGPGRRGGTSKPTTKGDEVITKGLARLQQATLGQTVAKKIEGGVGTLAEFLETVNDEMNYPK